MLLGNGDGTFQSPVEYPTGDCGTGFGNYGSTDTGLAVADLTGSGRPDIVVTSHSTDTGSDVGRVFVLLNQGNGTFGSPAYVGGAPGIYGVAVADLNGDGYPDLAVGEAPITGSQRGISIFYGNGDGTFQSPVYIADPALTDGTNTAGQVTGIAIADMNGDGIPDIVTAASASLNGGPGGTSVYLNGGGSGVNAPAFIPAPSTFAPQGLALGDVNGDGKPDVVLENNQPVDQNHPANVLVMLNTTPTAVAPAQTTGGGVPGDYQTTCSGCPVNTATGEFYKSFTDLQVPGRGTPLGFSRTYSTNLAAKDSPAGFGWTDSYNMSLSMDPSTGAVTIHQANGSQVSYRPNGLGGFTGPSSDFATLTKDTTTSDYT